MLLKDIPSRILNARSCRIVGTMINTNAEKLRKELASKSEKLPQKLEASLVSLEQASQPVASFLADDVSLNELDRDTDHILASLRQLYLAWIEVLSSTDYLPLPASLAQRRDHLEASLKADFPNGTKFLTTTPKEQWTHMDDMKRVSALPESIARTNALGLSEEREWILQWIKLYGDRVGVTDEATATKLAKLQEKKQAFHDALDKLKAQVFANFDEDQNEEHLKHRVALMGPYVEQVEALREADRRAKQARAEEAAKKAAAKKAEEEKKAEEAKKEAESKKG
jgi:hypothetical protein